jgi:O-antigen/teichoic acid export membrane protein
MRHNTIFFGGSLFIGVLNYLYYPVLGRLMQPAPFGEVQALVSLFLQITTFLSVLGLLAVNIVANHDATPARNRLIVELEKLSLLVSLVILLLTLAGGAVLQRFFHFGSPVPFVMLALAIVATVPFTFRTSYLRGKQYFGLTSLAGIVGAGAKLVFSAILVAWGFGSSGAIFGIVIAQVLAFLYGAHYARRHGFAESLRRAMFKRPDFRLLMPELKYALMVLMTSLTITLLYSIDILVVKHYFDAYTAGLYASIATVSRILFFLTASISQVLMPTVKLKQAASENLRILAKSFVLLIVVGGTALGIFCLAPRFVVGLLMGNTYLPHAGLLPRLSIAIFVVSILNLLLTYYLALRRYEAGLMALAGAGLTYGLMVLSHQTLSAVVNSLLYGSLLTTVLLAGWVGWTNRALFAPERR